MTAFFPPGFELENAPGTGAERRLQAPAGGASNEPAEAVLGHFVSMPAAVALGGSGYAAGKLASAAARKAAQRVLDTSIAHSPVSDRFQQIRQFGGLNPTAR